MAIQLTTSPRMTEGGEGNNIRMPEKLRTSIGVEIGDIVSVGKNSRLYVMDSFPEDIETYGGKFAFVSNETISSIEEGPIEPIENRGITIGCDPEFILINDTGKVVNADKVFPKTARLGSDAGLGELRPPPSKNSLDVVESLRGLIHSIPVKTKYCPVSCSYYNGWVSGFHIHFGMPQAILTYASEQTIGFIRGAVAVLDYYIGIPAMLADETDLRRLSTFGYGQPGDFRVGECTMEYRTPGGFHLRSPALAMNIMESCYTVMEDVIGRGELITRYWSDMSNLCSIKHFQDMYGIPDTSDTKKALVSKDRGLAEAQMDNIRHLYEKLYGYTRSKYIIDGFLAPPKNIPSPELLKNWKL